MYENIFFLKLNMVYFTDKRNICTYAVCGMYFRDEQKSLQKSNSSYFDPASYKEDC